MIHFILDHNANVASLRAVVLRKKTTIMETMMTSSHRKSWKASLTEPVAIYNFSIYLFDLQ